MATALGVQPDSNGNGVTPEVHRMIIAAQWHNTGVIDGLGVTGRSDLQYDVAAGVAVCSKGDADGKTLAYWPGGQTAAVSAGDASNPRIDLVWITAHNPKAGDADNSVVVGVTQGTPAANPVAPELPAGCTLLRSMRVPANATATSSATATDSINYAIPYGASMGLLAHATSDQTVNQDWSSNTKWWVQQTVTVNLPTDRFVDISYDARAHTIDGTESSYYLKLVIDGKDITDGNDEVSVTLCWELKRTTWPVTLSAGTHQVTVQARANTNRHQFQWNGKRNLYIYDRGVAV